MEYKKRKKIYKVCLFLTLMISILVICGVMYTDLYRQTPNLITLKAGIDQDIVINAPLSEKIYENIINDNIEVTSNSLNVDFSKTVKIHATKANSYIAKVKLFGLIPFKDIQIEVIDDIRLIPAGVSIGIYV